MLDPNLKLSFFSQKTDSGLNFYLLDHKKSPIFGYYSHVTMSCEEKTGRYPKIGH